jgi:uncharacterized membrane protein
MGRPGRRRPAEALSEGGGRPFHDFRLDAFRSQHHHRATQPARKVERGQRGEIRPALATASEGALALAPRVIPAVGKRMFDSVGMIQILNGKADLFLALVAVSKTIAVPSTAGAMTV